MSLPEPKSPQGDSYPLLSGLDPRHVALGRDVRRGSRFGLHNDESGSDPLGDGSGPGLIRDASAGEDPLRLPKDPLRLPARSSYGSAGQTQQRATKPAAAAEPAPAAQPAPAADPAREAHVVRRLLRGFHSLQKSEARLIRIEAALYAYLSNEGRCRKLGFKNVGDVARELIETPERTARQYVTLHRTLEDHPDVDRLFMDGRLTSCQVLALAPVLDRPDADTWIARAQRVTVRRLRREIKAGKPDAYENERERPCRIEMDVPLEIKAYWDSMVELGRKVSGYDVAPGDVLEAVMFETGRAGLGDVDDLVRPERDRSRRRRPVLQLVRPVPPMSDADVEEAERALKEVDRFRRRLSKMKESVERAARLDSVAPRAAYCRLKELRSLHNPLRILQGRLVKTMRRTRVDRRLGYESLDDFAADRLRLSDRRARELVGESFLFEHHPSIERAYAAGRIGLAKAHIIRKLCNTLDTNKWIDRAARINLGTFERECRILEMIKHYDPRLARMFAGPGPHYGMERILFEEVRAKHGYSVKELERELKRRGVRKLPRAGSLDPAINPTLLKRLEVLLFLLCMMSRRPAESAKDRRMFAVSEPHVQLTIHVTPEVKADTLALIRDFDRVHGPLVQRWIPLALASRYAEDIWNEQDPARVPTRRAILERDDYRCMVPGCRCRAMIEGNHIDPKGRGGSNEQWNIHSLCHFHHRLFHEGYLRITGEAPDKVRFEFCPEPGGPPILVTIGHLIVEMDGRTFP